jgi:hypothetical protein
VSVSFGDWFKPAGWSVSLPTILALSGVVHHAIEVGKVTDHVG